MGGGSGLVDAVGSDGCSDVDAVVVTIVVPGASVIGALLVGIGALVAGSAEMGVGGIDCKRKFRYFLSLSLISSHF